jgi:hypothetical protein
MGGFGSGGHNEYKGTVEHCKAIDVRKWKREGVLENPCFFTCFWKLNGQESSIGVSVQRDLVTLTYTLNKSESISDTIYLDRTPCNYGGHRLWFICPTCQNRAAKLYLRGKYFRCRNCQELNYYSSKKSGDEIEKIDNKILKVHKKLKGDSKHFSEILWRIPEKPRYMHHKTYKRLTEELWQLFEKRDQTLFKIMIEKFGQLA